MPALVASGCGSMRTSFFGYEKSKSALTAPAPLFMWWPNGLELPKANRASARVRGAAGVCAYPAQAPPPGGNGGGAAASGSAAGDDLYGAGMGVPATPSDFLLGKGFLDIAPCITNLLYYLYANKETPRDPFGRDQIASFQRGCAY